MPKTAKEISVQIGSTFGVEFGFCLSPRHGPPVMVMPVLI
jgi:hypothetical protein